VTTITAVGARFAHIAIRQREIPDMTKTVTDANGTTHND
jgi:hypothetical protein